jgi:hypothetical protein
VGGRWSGQRTGVTGRRSRDRRVAPLRRPCRNLLGKQLACARGTTGCTGLSLPAARHPEAIDRPKAATPGPPVHRRAGDATDYA